MTTFDRYCVAVLCLLFPCFLSAQSNYTLINSAAAISGCHCYQLTSDQTFTAGGVYLNNAINLNNSFDYTFNVFLGCNTTNGADGMTFILTPNITGIGAVGGGLGYSGLSGYSLAVEYDTYQNAWDPPYNHIALEDSGQVEHPVGTVMGPYPALPNNANIDDCNWHTTRIVWDVNAQTYTVYFDGNLIFTYTGNIVADFFGGNPVVNWGWAGGTGADDNVQEFCVQSISAWVAGTNYQSCNVRTMQFTDISTSNVASVQSWSWNFGDPASGLSDTSTIQNPSHTFSGYGTYTVTLIITDVTGCHDTSAHHVTVDSPIVLTPALTEPKCNGDDNGSISVAHSGGTTVSGGYVYTWSNNSRDSTSIDSLVAGIYQLTVTDGICTTTASYTLDQPLLLTAATSGTDAPCGGKGAATVTMSGGTPPYQYSWSDGGTTSTIYAPVGIDSVTITDAMGCSVGEGFLITNDSFFNITAIPDTATIIEGNTVPLDIHVFDNGAGPVSNIAWMPPSGLSCSDCLSPVAAPSTTTQYTINATTDSGCVSAARVLITVIPQHQLYIPNVFTPNGDGIDDYWEAFGDKDVWVFCSVEVFDRWGEKVFSSDDINFQWDGRYKDEDAEPGEYVYQFKVVFEDGYSVANKGSVMLIR